MTLLRIQWGSVDMQRNRCLGDSRYHAHGGSYVSHRGQGRDLKQMHQVRIGRGDHTDKRERFRGADGKRSKPSCGQARNFEFIPFQRLRPAFSSVATAAA